MVDVKKYLFFLIKKKMKKYENQDRELKGQCHYILKLLGFEDLEPPRKLRVHVILRSAKVSSTKLVFINSKF